LDIGGEMKLSEHFDSEEFGKELTAQVYQNYYLLSLLCLERIREEFGEVRITSGYRSAFDQERLIKEGYHPAPTSQHLFGEAADFICPYAESMGLVYRFLLDSLKWPGEVIWYKKRGHVHVALPHIGVKADHFINDKD